MFLKIVRVRSTEQSGIKGVKILFDSNIIDMQYNKKPGWRAFQVLCKQKKLI